MNCGKLEIGHLESLLGSVDCLVLQNEVPYEVNLQAARLARENKIPVVWDPAPFVTGTQELIKHVDFLTPNQNEAELLANCEITDEKSIHNAFLKIKESSDAVCLITMGEDGVYFLSGPAINQIPSFLVESVDSVAAGDAFTGGFAVALSEGETLRSAARFGCASGALATTKLGAQSAMPFRKEVDQMINL